MSGFDNSTTAGDGTLILVAIHSPDYEPGVSGWAIFRDGSAEFNDVTVRGTVIASTFETAESGQRIVINPADSPTSIYFYPGSGSNFSRIYSTDAIFPGEATLRMDSGQNAAGTSSSQFEVAGGVIVAKILNAAGTVRKTQMQVDGDRVELFRFNASDAVSHFLNFDDDGLYVDVGPVPSTLLVVGPPAANDDYTSTGGEATMTGTQTGAIGFRDGRVYRAIFNVQYDAQAAGGVGCSVRFRIRQGTNTSGTFVGGAQTPIITAVYSTFRPTQRVEAVWQQSGNVTSALVLTMQREAQASGTVVGQLAASDYFATVEDLGPGKFV